MGEKEQKFRERAPALRQKDIREINALFPTYFFRRRSTGEVWTTCCGRHETLGPEAAIWTADHVSEPGSRWDTRTANLHDKELCPFCGAVGTVKDIKYTGRRDNLTAWRRFALCRWDGKALWVECGEGKKEYGDIRFLTKKPTVCSHSLYRFGKNAVECIIDEYGLGCGILRKYPYAAFDKKTVDHPFWSSVDGRSYRVIGLEDIGKSPVKYCQAERWAAKEHEIVKFLHLSHVYSRQVEMLMKAGMGEVVWDLAIRGVKHCAVLDWKAAEPKKAWKLPPEVLREFLRTLGPEDREIRKLEVWKSLNRKGKAGFREVMEAWPLLGDYNAMDFAKKWGAEPLRLWRYLERQSGKFHVWRDYVEAGQKIGLNLYRDDVLFPQSLAEAHDAAVAERNRRAQAERDRQWAEQKRQEAEERRRAEKAAKGYDQYRKKLEKKYGWEAGKYRITVPEGKEAIEREGRELKHCVGGYADRHIQGKTVILFMRKVSHPDTPWLTIEMNGAELVQIHGYRNEGAYSAKRIAPDPREVYREWLDRWLAWVANGSRRKKDGTPIEAKNKAKEDAA